MGLKAKEKESLLNELSNYAASLYYLLNKQIINLQDIENIIFKDDYEMIGLLFPKLVSKVREEDINNSYLLYQNSFPRKEFIEEVIMSSDEGKYKHLKNIDGVAMSDDFCSSLIKEDTYIMGINFKMLGLILDMIGNDKKDAYIRFRDDLKDYNRIYTKMYNNYKKLVEHDINDYYIGMIVGRGD